MGGRRLCAAVTVCSYVYVCVCVCSDQWLKCLSMALRTAVGNTKSRCPLMVSRVSWLASDPVHLKSRRCPTYPTTLNIHASNVHLTYTCMVYVL